MAWAELLLSAGSGGVLGLVGAGFKQWMSWKDKKLTFRHQIEMAAEERKNMDKEMELAKVKGEIQLELVETEADARNLQAALEAESKITGTSQWVADLRGSLRPIVTYLLDINAIVLIYVNPTNPMANELIFMAMTATGYWFGDRPARRK